MPTSSTSGPPQASQPPASSPQAVSPEGSLGLLAYGDLGLEAWRAAKAAAGLPKCSHSRAIPKPKPDAPSDSGEHAASSATPDLQPGDA